MAQKYLAPGGYPYIPAGTYPYVGEKYEKWVPPVTVAEAPPVAKPFPWKWVIFGGIGLLVAYSVFKK